MSQAEIVIIAAVDKNMAIGNKGGLLCHMSADLKRFKDLTWGHTVIMGRRTFESLPKGALPGRRNIVVSTTLNSLPGCDVANSFQAALSMLQPQTKAFVIGGASLYKSGLEYAAVMELSRIDAEFEADVFFPEVDWSEWDLVSCEKRVPDEKNPYPYNFCTYRRKQR